MFIPVHQPKVFDAVVVSNVVDVMDFLIVGKVAPNAALHDHSVKHDVSVAVGFRMLGCIGQDITLAMGLRMSKAIHAVVTNRAGI